MTWIDRLKKILAKETLDAKDEFQKLRASVDKELTRRERELNATPAEGLELVLEEIERDSGRLDELERELTDAAATRAVDSEVTPVGGRARLLGPTDVSSSPHLAAAQQWVSITPRLESAGPSAHFDHDVWIEEWVGPLIGEEHFESIDRAVAAHPLVLAAAQEDREVLLVRAPDLHPEDLRLIVAAAIAVHLPDDWEERLDAWTRRGT